MKTPIRILLLGRDDAFWRRTRVLFEPSKSFCIAGEVFDDLDEFQLTPQLNPNVILIDINVRCRRRLGLVRKLSSLYPAGKLLLVGSRDQEQLVLDFLKVGARGYIDKENCTPAEVIAAVHAANRGEVILFSWLAGKILDAVIRAGGDGRR